MEAEVNVPFCREHGIKMFRRKSGGGCVYSDWGNIMVSYIVKGEDVTATFNTFLQRLASALRDIGVDATVSGRNDIQIGGRKVSGNAFYKVPGKSIVHGTLLFASDFERMQQAITPSAVKLQSKGVASVRQHVTNLSEHTDMPIEEFKRYLIDRFCDSERMLTAAEIARIEEIEQTYLDESFFNGSNPAYTVTKSEKSPVWAKWLSVWRCAPTSSTTSACRATISCSPTLCPFSTACSAASASTRQPRL